ncbi:MAG: putative Ig domain-containing protein [Gammaproteobacteria bacterium]|nr:putative Ig domain-containing protein [Gammaproteobacteria bacterium]
MISAPARRSLALACLVVVCGLVACSGGSGGTGISPGVGTGSGITITSATGSVLVQEAATLKLTATVSSDTTNAGVSWSLSGAGTLSGATATEVTYNAPAVGTIIGTSTPIITATSVTDSTKSSAVSLVVSGSPVIDPMTLFPANADTSWGATIVVIGGESPYAWSVSSGTLPAGITLASSTTSTVTVNGTPTTTGTYAFQIKATDKQSRTATVDLTLVITPKTACVLSGRYALLYTGYHDLKWQTRAASFSVAGDGTVTGVMDTRSASGANENETLTGTCTTRSANNGRLKLTGSASGELEFDFAVRTSLADGRIHLASGGGTASGSGLITRQDATAFALAALPQSAAFGLLGADSGERSLGLAGWLDRDAAGTVTGGSADSNATPPLSAAGITGSLGAPDVTSGRGLLLLDIGGTSYRFAYYVASANRLLLINVGAEAAAQRLAGFLTTRAASFDASALAAPGILSLWGAGTGPEPIAVLALGRLSNANTGAGTLDLKLDTADRSTAVAGTSISGAGYSVDAHGRATLNYTLGGVSRTFALYLDGTASGYVVEKGSTTGNAGLLEAQSAGPFDTGLPGLFVFGTQYAQSPGPITLAPIVAFSGGVLSGNYVSGYYSIDGPTGRGTGTLSISGQGTASMVLYVVRPERVLVLQFSAGNRGGTLNWIEK